MVLLTKDFDSPIGVERETFNHFMSPRTAVLLSPARHPAREFVKKTGTIAAVLAGGSYFQLPLMAETATVNVSLILDSADDLTKQASVQWAAGQLREVLTARRLNVQMFERLDQAPAKQECILITGKSRVSELGGPVIPDAPEALLLARLAGKQPLILAAGSDIRGDCLWRSLELADRVSFANDPLAPLKSVSFTQRALGEPYPQPSAGCSPAMSRTKPPRFNSREFWSRYLTMLATNRFKPRQSRVRPGLRFPDEHHRLLFSFRVSVPVFFCSRRYNVRAVPLPGCRGAIPIWRCCASSATRPQKRGLRISTRPLDTRLPLDQQPARELHHRGSHPKRRGRIVVKRSACCLNNARTSRA